MEGSDEQLIIPEPISLHHADDSRALLDAGNPHTLPPGTVVKWVTSPGEHADVPGQLLATQDHAVIRAWAEARFGAPLTIEQHGFVDQRRELVELAPAAHAVPQCIDLVAHHPEIMHGSKCRDAE